MTSKKVELKDLEMKFKDEFIGTYALSAGYSDVITKKGTAVRTLIRKDFDNAFKKVDILLTPTCPTTAFLKGDFFNDPLSMYLSDL